jgi:hypothetical protein
VQTRDRPALVAVAALEETPENRKFAPLEMAVIVDRLRDELGVIARTGKGQNIGA